MRIIIKNLLTVSFLFVFSLSTLATTYYIDFDSGSDTNDGLLTTTAWKHAPGDENASNNAASVKLLPGDTILFKGGVNYRGSVSVPASGAENSLIHYIGDSWPGLEGVKAIVDGSEQLTGWKSEGSDIYSADIPIEYQGKLTPFTINLHEFNYGTGDDEFLWISQDPNPDDWFFFDDYSKFFTVSNQNLSRTSITDTINFNQTDSNYWKNSSILVWVNPNAIVIRDVKNFNPGTQTITFDSLAANAIYEDERDQYYAIYNSVKALDQKGEYFINLSENKIYLYPRHPESIDSSVSFSARKYGINVNGKSFIEIRGFSVKKFSGSLSGEGMAIGCHSLAYLTVDHIIIRNNEVIHNRHADKGNSVFLSHAINSVVENNLVSYNPRMRGILLTNSDNVLVKNNNVIRSGSTSIGFFTVTNSQILNNVVSESKGSHANGITVYLGCKNVLVANNIVTQSNNPMTLQDAGNIYFINNIIDADKNANGFNEWSRTTGGPWASGEIVFLNNTIVNTQNHNAVSIGASATDKVVNDTLIIPANTYVFINNIIDGGASHASVLRSHNIYTGLLWNQNTNYGWSLSEGESVVADPAQLFKDSEQSDFHLNDSSRAINKGIDVSQYYPKTLFPDCDFSFDFDDIRRPQGDSMDIGAYEYNPNIPDNLTVNDTIFNFGETGCFNAYDTITVAGGDITVEFRNGSSVDLIAEQSIIFLPGFHAVEGCSMNASITTDRTFCDGVSGSSLVNQPFKKSLEKESFWEKQVVIPGEKFVKIFPNPSNGRFTIELSNFENGASINVYNILGAKIYQSASKIKDNYEINLPGLKRGIYIVKVTGEKEQVTKKISVN
jgi:parallel beta-helix repeat protein